MLGAHDSYTYMVAENKLVNTITSFWRCQKKTIKEQYDLGVRLFDIRVNKQIQNGKFTWQVSHGLAKFNQNFVSLTAICSYFKKQYPGTIVRIVLESGEKDQETVDKFKSQAEKMFKTYKDMIWQVVIKKGWVILHTGKKFEKVNDYCCHLFNWNIDKDIWYNIKHFEISSYSISSWAKNHNPKVTQEMKDDPNILYFMDYVGIY